MTTDERHGVSNYKQLDYMFNNQQQRDNNTESVQAMIVRYYLKIYFRLQKASVKWTPL